MFNPGHRSPRATELLEGLKAEFESLVHDANMFKMQRDDYERKLQAQLAELGNLQQTLYDLERNHTKVKQTLEEEVLRWRRQSEARSGTQTATNHTSASNGTFGGAPAAVRVDANPIIPNFGGLPSASMFSYAMSPIENVNKRPFSSTSTTPTAPTIPATKRQRPTDPSFYPSDMPPVTGGKEPYLSCAVSQAEPPNLLQRWRSACSQTQPNRDQRENREKRWRWAVNSPNPRRPS